MDKDIIDYLNHHFNQKKITEEPIIQESKSDNYINVINFLSL